MVQGYFRQGWGDFEPGVLTSHKHYFPFIKSWNVLHETQNALQHHAQSCQPSLLFFLISSNFPVSGLLFYFTTFFLVSSTFPLSGLLFYFIFLSLLSLIFLYLDFYDTTWMFIKKSCCWKKDLIFTIICVNFLEVKEFEGNVNLSVFTSGY